MKTLYFRCILISRFWNVETLHFNLAFSQCSTSIYLAFDRRTEFSRVFNFAILSYSRNSRKFDAREKCFTVFLTNFLYVISVSVELRKISRPVTLLSKSLALILIV